MNIRGIVALAVVFAVLVPAAPASADLADPAGAWHVTQLRLAEAHRTSRGAGVTVALLGDGVNAHRDVVAAAGADRRTVHEGAPRPALAVVLRGRPASARGRA